MPVLNEEETAQLLSCMDEIRNIVGDTISEKLLVETIIKNKYDYSKSLDDILTTSTSAGASTVKKCPVEKGKLFKKKFLLLINIIFTHLVFFLHIYSFSHVCNKHN